MRGGFRAATVLSGVALVLSAVAVAATIVGTPRNDVLRGTAKADKLYGKAGNDRIFGLGGDDVLYGQAGNDVLSGGPGEDTLSGGQGADRLQCGPGRDSAVADARDKVSAECESVKASVLPSISIGDASVEEGNSGVTLLSFDLRLSTAVGWTVSVAWATADGTAKAGSDYTSAQGTLTFPAGEDAEAIEIEVIGNGVVEPDETLTLNLSNPTNATIADGSATGTIENDDQWSVQPGHYSGTTSADLSISFDVVGPTNRQRVLNLVYWADAKCPGFSDPWQFHFGQITISPGGTFEATSNIAWGGAASVAGAFSGNTSSGTARANIEINREYLKQSCSTDDLTWNARLKPASASTGRHGSRPGRPRRRGTSVSR